MTTPRFLIAKYAPDLARMEPRNFGVFVWNDGIVKMKCIRDQSQGLRRLHLNDRDTYRQWLKFWDIQCERPTIKRRDGTVVDRASPDFVDAFRATASGHYLLSEGGQLMNKVPPDETAELLEELFDTLVTDAEEADESPKVHTEAELLSRAVPKVLKRSGIVDRPGFRESGYDWLCAVGDTMQTFHFDYGVHITQPECVLQKVQLNRQATVHHAAFMFEAMQHKYLNENECVSLVYATPSDLRDDSVSQAYRLLKSCGTVINVADEGAAAETLKTFSLSL